MIAEPINKSHLILMPQHASLQDIAVLKTDAYQAEVAQNWDLAKCLWIRANAAAAGQDMDVIEALSRIQIQNRSNQVTPPASDLITKRASVYNRDLLEAVMNGNLIIIFSICLVASLALFILNIPVSIWYNHQVDQSILHLEKLLSYGPLSDWKRADSLTGKIMRETYTNQYGFSKLSCERLNRINQSWLKSSNNILGFTPQKYAWQAATADLPQGSKPNDALAAFGELVGWRSLSGTKK
jgi:hypothetical protein